ncbi:MAG: tripartite tricarboxylate transporter TctB family protein [Candidatus Rokuibacteriota bacterium]
MDWLSAVGLAVLAGGYLLANRHYPLDTLATPGSGIFPLAVGLLMLGLAVAQAVAAARSRPGATASPAVTSEDRAGGRGRALTMVALLVAYAGAAGVTGFLTASFGVVLVSSRLLGARDWLRPVALACGVAVAAHLIFVVWLGVPFPTGLLR